MPHGSETRLAEDISIHIFTVSAALVGVCLTVIGITQLIAATENVETLIDDFLAVDALFFLVACLLAYAALRSGEQERRRRFERGADAFLVIALCLMALACALITYSVI